MIEALLNKIENYPFESQGGDLRNCKDWHDLRALLVATPGPVEMNFPHPEVRISKALADKMKATHKELTDAKVKKWMKLDAGRAEDEKGIAISGYALLCQILDAMTEPDVLSRQSPVEADSLLSTRDTQPKPKGWQCYFCKFDGLDNQQYKPVLLQLPGAQMIEALLNKIEGYGFECQGGPLTLCQDWMKLRAVAASPSDTSQGVSEADGREAFEKWCTNVRKLSVKRMPDGAYLYLETRHAWFGWLESRAALRSEPGRYPTGEGGRVNLTPADIEGLTVRSETTGEQS